MSGYMRLDTVYKRFGDLRQALYDDTILWGDAADLEDELVAERDAILKQIENGEYVETVPQNDDIVMEPEGESEVIADSTDDHDSCISELYCSDQEYMSCNDEPQMSEDVQDEQELTDNTESELESEYNIEMALSNNDNELSELSENEQTTENKNIDHPNSRTMSDTQDPHSSSESESNQGVVCIDIIVKNLPKNITEEKIRRTFDIFGEIVSVRLPYDYIADRPRRYAIVRYSDSHVSEDVLKGFECGELRIPVFMSGIYCMKAKTARIKNI